MGNKSHKSLLFEIERLRSQLHDKAKESNLVHEDFIISKELLEISNQLDELIIKYMRQQ